MYPSGNLAAAVASQLLLGHLAQQKQSVKRRHSRTVPSFPSRLFFKKTNWDCNSCHNVLAYLSSSVTSTVEGPKLQNARLAARSQSFRYRRKGMHAGGIGSSKVPGLKRDLASPRETSPRSVHEHLIAHNLNNIMTGARVQKQEPHLIAIVTLQGRLS